ncbi:MAG TPA: restriction endonuclease [Spirochaetota bacterium]|nr:restriction endonuclease [Spirochaetota bacterium]
MDNDALKIIGWMAILLFFSPFIVAAVQDATVFIKKSIRDKIYNLRRPYMPCKHGVKRAFADVSLCPDCLDEHNKMMAERDKERERIRQDAQNRERIKYSNWAEDVHMTEYLQTMNPIKFEELVSYLYTQMGYETELTTATGDHGVDLFVYKDDKKIAIQCKRVISKVGEPVIRDLYGAMHDAGADAAIIVTTGSVSKQAKAWIQNKPIEIIELLALRKLIGQHIPRNMIEIPKEVSISTRSKTYCPRCGNSMRMIDTKNGSFYGCRSYPSCRYTISAKRFNRANSLKRPWD